MRYIIRELHGKLHQINGKWISYNLTLQRESHHRSLVSF